MDTLIYRTSDVAKWGAGKGSNLTPDEVDENFWAVAEAVQALETNPALPSEIESITVNASNQMLITLSNLTVFGPYQLPTAKFLWTGAWQPDFDYKTSNLFVADEALYIVNVDFTSGESLDPNQSVGGQYVISMVMPFPSRVRIGWFWPTKPGIGLPEIESDPGSESDTSVPAMFAYLAVDAFVLPVDFAQSLARLRVASATGLSFPILHNETEIGTCNFAANATVGTFLMENAVAVEVGDLVRMLPDPAGVDPDAFGLNVTLVGRLGLIPESDSSSS